MRLSQGAGVMARQAAAGAGRELWDGGTVGGTMRWSQAVGQAAR